MEALLHQEVEVRQEVEAEAAVAAETVKVPSKEALPSRKIHLSCASNRFRRSLYRKSQQTLCK
jgi:hypothetical protein